MELPFTTEQFLYVFENYNKAVFFMPVVLTFAGVASLFLIWKNNWMRDPWTSVVLAFLWAWMGVVYHLAFFAAINEAAVLFGWLFLAEGFLFLYYGFIRRNLRFRWNGGARQVTGSVLVVYSLAAYPVSSYLAGHSFPAMPTFGVPCPTTVFTLGMLLLHKGKLPLGIVVIPLLWTMVGFLASVKLGMLEDLVLPVSSLVFLFFLLKNKSTAKRVKKIYEGQNS